MKPVSEMTEEDMVELAAYFSAVLRHPKCTMKTSKRILKMWDKWPKAMFKKFCGYVISSAGSNAPWVDKANLLIKYGLVKTW